MELTFFYPCSQQALFTNREYYLGLLDLTRESLVGGSPHHLAFLGPRRIGKTLLVKEFIQRALSDRDEAFVPVYLDCQRAPLTPEFFAVHYTGNVLFWLLRRGQGRVAEFLDIGFQLKEASPLGPKIADYFYTLDRALKMKQIDQRGLLDQAFELPELLAQTLGRRFMIFLDELPELAPLSNYPQVGRIMDLLRAILQTQERVAYVAAGSAIGMMQAIFYDPASPLAVHFRTEMLPPFTREDGYTLIEKHLRETVGPVSEGLRLTIYRWTYGHPFYIGALCERLVELIRLQGASLTAETVEQAFVLETLWQNGRISNLCRFTLERSLERARGQTLLQLILQILAAEDGGLTLSALAGRLKRSTGQTRTLLRRLMAVDLIVQQGALYDFRDPVMKLWAAYYYQGLELPAVPRQQILHQLVAEVSQRYQRISTELGLAQESQVRELMRHFAGQQVDGSLFGVEDALTLPCFASVAPHQTPEGELDAVAETCPEPFDIAQDRPGRSDNERWAVEIKWRNEPATRKELEAFWRKARTIGGHPLRLWFIARAGFRDSALRFGQKQGILLSSQLDLQALAERLGVRLGK